MKKEPLDQSALSSNFNVSRRRMLQGAGGVLAAAALPLTDARDLLAAPQDSPGRAREASTDLTGELARYMVQARGRELPEAVTRDAKHHILDTVGAMVSGSRLKAGQMATSYIRAQGGTPEASVIGANFKTSAVNAALANGMCGHGDETDDVELVTKSHPGISSIAAALVMAEREGRSGAELLRAVVLGYDLCCNFLQALGGQELVRGTHRSAEGVSSTFAALGAAASLARLDETGMRYALSYAAQQVSGLWSWTSDRDHVEKAFDFAGMGARNGVTAVTMVQAGFTGVLNVFDCEHNVLQALSSRPRPDAMLAGLGTRFWVTETSIKTYSVGYPIQPALDAFLTLRRENSLTAATVDHIVVRLPSDAAGIVDNSAMPDVNCQYILALALAAGTVSFADSHSRERMNDPQIQALKKGVQLIADPKLVDPAAPRSALVEVTLKDGRTVEHFTKFAPGTKENPISTEALNAKVRDLMTPVLGKEKTERLIERFNNLEQVRDSRELPALYTV